MIYYSIIIAHKNSPELLQFCLESIPIRDDVQVIVVDDNSDSGKVDFAEFARWKGTHYEFYLTKEGKGAGYVRNVGLEHAEGRWVVFLDADDFLLPGVNEILDEEKETDADIIFFRTKAVMLEDRVSESQRGEYYNRMIDRYLVSSDDMEIRSRWLSAANKFLKLKLIQENDIRFDEILYSNDNVFSVKVGVFAGKVVVRNKSYYCITESGTSLTSNFMKKPGEFQVRADAFFRAQKILHDHGFPIDENRALSYLSKLFSENRKAFVFNCNLMLTMGYKKFWLLRRVFKDNGRKAAFKRRVYSFFCTRF